ncbi:hypothetical protein EON65_24445 [archaeon]|nr:MAG: hypothetical protein EON65_24445 [archaeon]
MPARTYAIPYLRIRAFTFLPCLLSTVGFAVYRGTLDVYTPLFISLVSNIVNVVLDPVLIFSANMGVAGAALATCASELTSFLLYTCAFIQKGLMPSFRKLSIPPSFELLLPMLLGGLSMQMRSIALNIAMLAVNRVAQGMDSEGVYAAAHTLSLQVFQLGSVLSMALSTVAAVLIPSVRAKHGHNTYTALTEARQAANRLLTWSVFVGCFLAGLQLSLLPLLSFFSPLLHVQEAARLPTVLGAALQLVNCIVWTGEGIQTGNQRFAPLAATTLVATVGMLVSLRYMKHSLVGVWGSFGVLAGVRLLGVLREHNRAGPLAPNEMQKVRDHKEL